MNLEDFIDEQFVNDYDLIKQFMIDVNDILEQIKINNIYQNYNDFCVDIKKHLFDLVSENDTEITTETLIIALNNMVRSKILEDVDYEYKIKVFFDEPYNILDVLNSIKSKK